MIVLDSSFLVAYHNTRDAHHVAAAAGMADLVDGRWGRGLLLEYVFVEVLTVLLARHGHDTAVGVGEILLDAHELEFVPCSDFFGESLARFREQEPGTLSFTDAAIVAVALATDDRRVATFDDDFRRIGGLVVVPG